MSENGTPRTERNPAAEAAKRERLVQFGDGWARHFGYDPNQAVSYARRDGTVLKFRLGDFALVSPHSQRPFSEYGAMLQADTAGMRPEQLAAHQAAVAAQRAALELAFQVYTGQVEQQTPPARA